MKTLQTQVVVVGGGPSGATAARTLARQNVPVILLEKNFLYEKPCGGGLKRSAFNELDIPHSFCSKEVDTLTLVSAAHKRVDVALKKDTICVVHRSEFDASLRTLAKNDGAELIEGRCTSIEEDADNGVLLKVKTADEALLIKASYCIAADGVNSMLRKKLTGTSPAKVLTLYKNLSDGSVDSCEFWLGSEIAPGYYAWNFPHSIGSSIGTIAGDSRAIHRYFKMFSTYFDAEVKPKGFYIPEYKGDLFYAKRTFFVGDAAGLVMPFTYEGIYFAMKSGRLAAEAIIEHSPGQYEQKWKRMYHRRFRFMHILQRMFMRSDWMSSRLVNALENPVTAERALRYWMGEIRPPSLLGTIAKVMKLVMRRR